MEIKNIQNTGKIKARYFGGSYAVFGIVINGVRYSAWYDSEGNLVDCERHTNRMTTISVSKRHTKILHELARIGAYWK